MFSKYVHRDTNAFFLIVFPYPYFFQLAVFPLMNAYQCILIEPEGPAIYHCCTLTLIPSLSFSPTHTLAYSESVKHQGEVYSDCGQMSHLGIRQHQSCCQYRTAEPFILPTREGCKCMCAWWKACIYLFTGAESKKYVFESDKIHLLFHVP